MGQTRLGDKARPRASDTSPPPAPRAGARRALIPVELLTGGSALLCGGLLVIRPDGSLLGLPTSVLARGPFTDWRLPGLLLGGLVGVGYLTAAALERSQYRLSSAASVLAGIGLVVFEVVEWRWLGFHPLQAVFMGVGASVVTMALTGDRPTSPQRPRPTAP